MSIIDYRSLPKSKKIAIGMSGGVDSSVVAYLLKKEGYDVFGLFMKNWEEEDDQGNCNAAKEFEDVVSVCQHLDIPYYSVNFVKEYWDQVFSETLQVFKAGLTPNPDVLCNREIKFNVFLKKARSLGADYLATGHYCQIENQHEKFHLMKGADSNKDQSYFLYMIKEEAIKQSLFPIGHLDKKEVRSIALEAGLSTSKKKDSTGICFIGERNFKNFLQNYIKPKPGPILTTEGKKIGMHDGLAFYTIGQKSGFGLGGGSKKGLFVAQKKTKQNTLVVAEGGNHPSLFHTSLKADNITWISSPPSLPFKCSAKIRYRQADQPCTVEQIHQGLLKVKFDEKQRAITPGQSVVFYDGDICLGGALIIEAFNS